MKTYNEYIKEGTYNHKFEVGDYVQIIGVPTHRFNYIMGEYGTVIDIEGEWYCVELDKFDQKLYDYVLANKRFFVFDIKKMISRTPIKCYYFFFSKYLRLVEQPLDDRFEKWEERKINEEYDYEENEFEVGDHVKFKKIVHYGDIKKEIMDKYNDILKDKTGIIIGKSFDYLIIKLDDEYFDYSQVDYITLGDKLGLLPEEIELVKDEPLDDRFEKWEEKKIK